MADARDPGLDEGLERGLAESCMEIARNALLEGASLEFVRNITGLDIDTLKTIQAGIL